MKLKKFILCGILLSGFILGSYNPRVNAKEVTFSKDTIELIKKYPGLKEDLMKDTSNIKLINTDTKYFKITKKYPSLITNSLGKRSLDEKMIPITKKEYDLADKVQGSKLQRSFRGEKPCENSWIKLSTQVYREGNKNLYEAYCFWEWKTQPNVTRNDKVVLSASQQLIAPKGNRKSVAKYYYDVYVNNKFKEQVRLDSTPREQAHGVVQNVPLKNGVVVDASHLNRKVVNKNHRGYVSTRFMFSNSSGKSAGNIYSQYFHETISIGDISIGTSGVPSISGGISTSKSCIATVQVYN